MRTYVVIAALLVALLPAPIRGSQAREIDFTQLDRTVAEELSASHTPGAAVAVVVDGRVVYAKGYGVSNAETGAPLSSEMLFRIGSTTKMFTAAALATVAERKNIRLDAPIGTVVEGLDPSIARVTAHQLLSQSSGIRDFGSPITSQDEASLAQNVRSWKQDVFFTEPGAIYSYSSPGYWLAGFVAQEIHGKPYAETLEELVFRPLGMDRTTLRPLVATSYPFAQGHTLAGKKAEVVRPIFNNAAMWPGGSIYSNVHELARFTIALMDGGKIDGKQVLPPSVAAALPAQQVRLPGPFNAAYGYGLLSYETRGVRLVGHGGATRGYGATIDMVPERRFAVIVLTNRSGETLGKSRAKAMGLALGLAPEEAAETPKPIPMDTDEMRRHVGRYVHEPMVWEVLVRDGRLYLKQDGTESEMFKVGENAFSLGAPGEAAIVLVPNASGTIEHLFAGLYAARRASSEQQTK